MTAQPDLFSSWICHARPAYLGGRECGHANNNAPRAHFGGVDIECCESCGCTRKASEDREAKERRP
jgi:hypothetical protein